MEAALNNLSGLSDETKVVVLGDMFEIGKDVLTEHQNIADLITKAGISKAFLIGESFYETKINHPNIYKFKSFEDFKTYFEDVTFQNATILIKASRGMALERALELI
jgi:UDP-N-acetylmuramoyl-tripeptide--D-alanyl-D-alanine ligase